MHREIFENQKVKFDKQKTYMSYDCHMTTKLTREEYYKLAQKALSERIEQLIKQREATRRYRQKQEKKNVVKKRR